MQIKSITATNFVNYRKAEIKPGKVNLILGNNYAGKSALKNAIEYALRGIARGMINREGQNNLVLNRIGKGEVELELDNIKILRNTNNRLAINDVNQNLKEGQAEILKKVGTSDEALEIIFETDKIVSMGQTERSKYFSKIFSAKTAPEEFAAILRKKSIDTKIINMILPIFSSGGLAKAYDFAVNKRRELKRDLINLQNKEPVNHIALIDGKEIDLSKFNPEKEKQVIVLNQSQLNQYRKDSGDHFVWETKQKEIEQNIIECSTDIDELKIFLAENEAKYNEQVILGEEIDQKGQKLEMVNDQIKHIQEIQNFLKIINLCDDCRSRLNKEFNQKWFSLEEDKTKLMDSLNCLKNLLINKMNSEFGEDIRSTYESKVDSLEKLSIKLTDLEKDNAEYLEGEPIDRSDDITKLEAETALSYKIMLKYNDYKKAADEFAGISIKTAKLNIEIETWDSLAKYINPEGNNLVNPILDKLAERVKYTAGLFGTDITVDNESGAILYKNFPIEFVSRSERYEAGIIIQDAVAYLLNIEILFLDGVEIFIGRSRETLSTAIMQLAKNYNNIFMFGSVPEKPDIRSNGVCYFWVENGTVVNMNGEK